MSADGLTIRRKSASPSSGTNIRRESVEIAKLVDIDLCIGCKACEVACKEWNGLPVEDTFNFGSYQSHQDLSATTWDLMRFAEVDLDDGDLAWLIRKDSCMHCDEPGCLLACPAPGAIVQYENGIVDFDQTKCIGCQYCVAGCPFDIPRYDRSTQKVYKCTMCVDRVGSGLEPACVKSCPTGAIRFGSKAEMVAYGETKVDKLQRRGFDDALLYDPSGVGGLHMMYVVPRGGMLGDYGLPESPEVVGTFSFIGGLRALRKIGAVGIWGGLIGAGLYWLRIGRLAAPSGTLALTPSEILAPAPVVAPAPVAAPPEAGVARYNFWERAVHWLVGLTFIALMLSGLALAYPRLAWLSVLFGGGQTMRAAHPWVGVAFSVGLVAMVGLWARQMLFDAIDRLWFRRIRVYARTGHSGLDVGRWNAGQKSYYWFALAFGVVLLVTGLPLWFPSIAGSGVRQWARLVHHLSFLLTVGGFIVHVLLSVFLFPGTMEGMTSGRVSRDWARWHHPRWYREQVEDKSRVDQ